MPFDAQGAGAGAEFGGNAGQGFGGAFGYFTAPGGGMSSLDRAMRILNAIKMPDFDMREIPYQDLQLVAQYFPEEFNAVIQGKGQAETIADSPAMRDAQVQSLQQLQGIGREGLPMLDRLQAQQSQEALAQENQRGQHAVLNQMAQRGVLGGGTELAARIGQGQQSADLAGHMGSDLAQQAMLRRLQGIAGAGTLAGGIRGQDVNTQQYNADSINRFNEFMSQLRTGVAQANAGTRERAHFANAGNAQRLAEQNTLGRTNMQMRNQEYINNQKERLYQDQLDKAREQTGVLGSMANLREKNRAQYMGAVGGLGAGIGNLGGGLVGGLGLL